MDAPEPWLVAPTPGVAPSVRAAARAATSNARDAVPPGLAMGSGILAVRRPGVRRSRVWEDLVVDLVVGVDVVADHRDRGEARPAGDGGQRDVDDVVTQATAVRPAPGGASGRVTADEAEPAEPGLPGQPHRAGP